MSVEGCVGMRGLERVRARGVRSLVGPAVVGLLVAVVAPAAARTGQATSAGRTEAAAAAVTVPAVTANPIPVPELPVLPITSPEPAPIPTEFAPVDQPGPALQVPTGVLDAALDCPAPLSEATREVVLMIPGTTVDPDIAFSWNYMRALDAEGIPFCSVTLPAHTDGDIQIAAEYVVHAIRTIHAGTGKRVILFGWSQGASTLPRWALRWWPDVRPMTASLVGLAPLNNRGSIVGTGPCFLGSCFPAAWQQSVGSAFMAALNSGPQTFDEIAYTAIHSRLDEVVTPNADLALGLLPEGPNVLNVAIQDVCATDLTEHLTIIASPTAYAIALDAFNHPGEPADLARVTIPQPCLAGTMPHVSPLALLAYEVSLAAAVPIRLASDHVDREPPLACYVTSSC
ncbi:MAG: lipase [Actinomycetota bacterium]|nr:lipase [Actinomycetota bacterium]